MAIKEYPDVYATHFDNDVAKGVDGRVLIGKDDGAPNFCMRLFEIAPSGFTPKHAHAWEHEIFFHSGEGEVLDGGEWRPVKAGSVAFISGGEQHQIRNTGNIPLVMVCLVPSAAPEM